MIKIRLHPELTKQIIKEFKSTHQTVYASLCYFNNSDLALKVRARALELLQQEIEQHNKFINPLKTN